MAVPVTVDMSDFLNGQIAQDQFRQEVAQSSITPTLGDIWVNFDEVTLMFSAPLSGGDQTTLDGIVATHTATGRLTVGPVATLPDGLFEDEDGFATDGRKSGEGAGNGTGVPIYWSTGEWRVFSTDDPVQA